MALNRFVISLIFLASIVLVPAASATPIIWNLNSVTFASGALATGSFDYNALTNTYSSINITVSGAAFGNDTYTILDPGFPSSANEIVVVPSALADFTNTPVLALDFSSALTNVGGTVNLVPSIHGIQRCSNPPCSLSVTVDAVAAGSATTLLAVPEPGTLALLGLGLSGLALTRRRRMH